MDSFDWSTFQNMIKDKDAQVIKQLPCLLGILYLAINHARSKQANSSHVTNVITNICSSTTQPTLKVIYDQIVLFKDCKGGSKFIKKADMVIQQGSASEIMNLEDIISLML